MTSEERQRGRAAYASQAWSEAFDALQHVDALDELSAVELEELATAAYMLGRRDDHVLHLERADDAHLASHDLRSAVRCAFWIGLNLLLRGKVGHATGWFRRAQRLLTSDEADSWTARNVRSALCSRLPCYAV